MGLSSFNRMRREKTGVEKLEAERFVRDNEARQARQTDRLTVHDENLEKVEAIQEAEHEATLRIGAKVEEGMKEGVLDEPLRRDHAAEIAGRNIDGVQEPKNPVERVDERIPSGTANEELVPLTTVESDGPTAEQVEAAAIEVGSPLPGTNEVEIPDDWEGRPWQTRVALAKRISGNDKVGTDEANAIIAAELAGRA